jgi:hypothetical protein
MDLIMARKKSDAASVLDHEQGSNGASMKSPLLDKGWDSDPQRDHKDAYHLANLETSKVAKTVKIDLPPMDIRTIHFTLVGDSPLLCHRWSEKAIKQMLDKQMGVATAGQAKKDPVKDYEDSLYKLPDGGFGFPAIAFKNAAVSACTSLGKAVTKVQARQAFHVVGKLLRIEGTPRMREDAVRLNGSTADLRYRGEFEEWKIQMVVRYNANVLTADQVVNLFNVAGFAVGVGEYRTEKDGDCGHFHVELA